jgi:hypothetical protein
MQKDTEGMICITFQTPIYENGVLALPTTKRFLGNFGPQIHF